MSSTKLTACYTNKQLFRGANRVHCFYNALFIMSRVQSKYQTYEETYSKEKAISGERSPDDPDVGVGGQGFKNSLYCWKLYRCTLYPSIDTFWPAPHSLLPRTQAFTTLHVMDYAI